jgi:ribonuclease BN (tRNA processing enzyme)
MEIFFLGTGTAIPVRMHSPAGLLVVADRQPILLDIGPGTLSRLEITGFSYAQLDHLFLTHFHSDHTLDLATLLQVFNYTPGLERTRPFSISACPGIHDFYQRMLNLFPELAPLTYKLDIHEVFRDSFSTGKLEILTAPTGHTPESIAFRLDDGEHSLVYSGDAAASGELTGLADKVDLLICECSFPSGWETDDHLNADAAGMIAQQAGVKSLVLTHTYPPAQAVDLIAQVRRYYDGKVQLAIDGLHLSL